MSTSIPTWQGLMDAAYARIQTEGLAHEALISKSDFLTKGAIVLGHFNYQVNNGGVSQWIDNDYYRELPLVLDYLKRINTPACRRLHEALDKLTSLLNFKANAKSYWIQDAHYTTPYDEDSDMYIEDLPSEGELVCEEIDKIFYALTSFEADVEAWFSDKGQPPSAPGESFADLDFSDFKIVAQPKPTVQLTGVNGNALVIVGQVTKALRKAGFEKDQVDLFTKEALAGDYDHMLLTCMRWVNVK